MKKFDLYHTLRSGQIFRWKITSKGAYICHRDKVFFVNKKGESDYEDIDYFLRSDQEEITHDNKIVKQAIKACEGIRVIRQDPWECLVTFIISQNNNQKRITKNVNDLCKAFGKELKEGFYSFPLPSELGDEEQLKNLKLGYRAGYVAALKNIDLNWLYNLSNLDYHIAKKELMRLRGVGPKVADCILLFSMGFDQACPEDTWMKKFFRTTGLTREDLGSKAGLIQQALFHAVREGLININNVSR